MYAEIEVQSKTRILNNWTDTCMCKILRGIEAEIKTKTQKNLERREFEQGEAQKGSNANVGSPRYQDPATRGSGFSENVRFPKNVAFDHWRLLLEISTARCLRDNQAIK